MTTPAREAAARKLKELGKTFKPQLPSQFDRVTPVNSKVRGR